MQDGSPCVDDELLFALAQGALASEELERIEGHLRDCADCRSVLAEAARSLSSPDSAPPGQAGGRIARYEVRALIGAGASGVVYRAFDPNLKRTVAIKVLRPDAKGDSPEPAKRMLREAQAMARLSAPQVVAVYDVGISQGAVYLVMEHVEGGDLKRWLGAAPRSTADILRVFRDAGRGLLAAHDKGLVHRDFKPANVLVAEDGRALVTDFGLAREADRDAPAADPHGGGNVELFTHTRGLVGTPAYMAPELFGEGHASPSSDQYAFCVALFSALFGRHPFGADEGIAFEALVLRAGQSVLTAEELNLQPGLLRRLHAVLVRGLSLEPSSRYTDMRELLLAIERAERLPRVRWQVGVAATLLIAVAVVALFSAQSKPEVAAPPIVVHAPPATSERRAPDPPHAEPTALTAPAEPSAPTQRVPSKRRTVRKKSAVRYDDGLKDPF